MPWDVALEAVLPELGEPWVPGVRIEAQFQIVIIKGRDLLGVELHGDATHSFLLIALHHLISVCPAITKESKSLSLLGLATCTESRVTKRTHP